MRKTKHCLVRRMVFNATYHDAACCSFISVLGLDYANVDPTVKRFVFPFILRKTERNKQTNKQTKKKPGKLVRWTDHRDSAMLKQKDHCEYHWCYFQLIDYN